MSNSRETPRRSKPAKASEPEGKPKRVASLAKTNAPGSHIGKTASVDLERQRATLIQNIKQGLEAYTEKWMETCLLLELLKNNRSLHAPWRNFPEVCEKELKLGESTGYEYAKAGRVIRVLQAAKNSDTSEFSWELPRNERQIKALLRVKDDAKVVEIWTAANRAAGTAALTEKVVREQRDKLFQPTVRQASVKERTLRHQHAIRSTWDKCSDEERRYLFERLAGFVCALAEELKADGREALQSMQAVVGTTGAANLPATLPQEESLTQPSLAGDAAHNAPNCPVTVSRQGRKPEVIELPVPQHKNKPVNRSQAGHHLGLRARLTARCRKHANDTLPPPSVQIPVLASTGSADAAGPHSDCQAEPDRIYPGEVARLGRETDRETREFLVDVRLKKLPESWTIGQRAEVFIETGRKPEALAVPQAFVHLREGKPGVFVKDAGKARWRDVVPGLRDRDTVEVAQGLNVGEQVLRTAKRNQAELADGRRIAVQ